MVSLRANENLGFLAGGGELGSLMRAKDWSGTSLGPARDWPQSLRTVVRLILNCAHPMYIFWGENGACLYNDAYRQSIGPERHPGSLGRPAREVWEEIWQIIGPQIEQVMSGGGATWHQNQLIPITRHGRRDEVYWTYTYSPIDDESAANGVGGVLVVCTETTETVLSERRAKLEGERFAQLFDQAPTFMTVLRGPEHRFEYANPGYYKLIGHRDVVGMTVRDALPDAVAQGYVELLDWVYTSGEAFVGQSSKFKIQAVPGGLHDERYLDFVCQPIRNSAGEVDGIFVEGVDVTERVLSARRNKALADLGNQLRDLVHPDELAYNATEILGRTLNVSRAGYGTIDIAAETISIERDWNMPGVESLAGLLNFRDYGSYIDDLKRGVTVVVTDAETDSRTAARADALKAISAQSFVNMPVTEQGGFVALLYLNHATARNWSNEELAFIREVAQRTRTAIERRRAEMALWKSEERFRFLNALASETEMLTEADAVLAATTRMTGKHLSVSICAYADMDDDQDSFTVRGDWSAPGSRSIVGHYKLKDFGRLAVQELGVGRPLIIKDNSKELPPDEAASFRKLGIEATICMPLVKDGRLTALMAVHNNKPRAWTDDELSLVREVTERSWAYIERVGIEEDLRASEDKFRTLTRAMPNQAWTSLPNGMLDWFNEQVYSYSGSQIGELDGSGWTRLVHPEDLPGAAPRWAEALMSGETYEAEFRLRRADGCYRWHIARAVPIKNAGGQVVRWIGTNTDIQAQKEVAETLSDLAATLEQRVEQRTRQLMEAEEALRQSQKMEAIGQLTGGIAHDFNNLMAGVISAVALTRRRIASKKFDDASKFMEAAETSARRAATLTQRLLAFSRRQSLAPAPCNLGALVRGMNDLIHQTIGENITLEIAADDDNWLAFADGHQFENAVLNLVINARDAMPGGGRLVISVANRQFSSADSMLVDGAESNDYVELSVADTGSGMAPAVVAKAFDPFFTTKPVGRGTGLGLSMVYGLARQSNGFARIESEPDKGTVVRLILPRADGVEGREESMPSPEITLGQGETVLVVEDDPTVRLLAVATLTDLGYHCLDAADAQAAMPMIQSKQDIALLLTDVGLPLIDGRKLAEMAREHRPGMKVLFMTGYAEKAATRAEFLGDGMDLITKPFDLEAFGQKVREVIDA